MATQVAMTNIRFSGGSHPAGPVIRAALQRRGLTLVEAEELAGFAQGQVSQWLSGRRGKDGVFRDQLQRLVDVLQAPELYDVITWKWRRWVFACTECGAVKEYQPAQFKVQRNRGHHQEAVIDELAGTGTYICLRCKQVEVGKHSPIMQEITRTRKRGGRRALRERMPKLSPEQRQEYSQRAWAANRGRPRGENERLAHAVGQIKPRPVGKWGVCRGCGYLAFSKHRHLDEKGEWVYRPVEMHHGCQDEHRRQQQKGFAQPPAAPRYARTGPQPTPEELAETFEMTLRFLRPWFPGKRRRQGATLEELAQQFHMTRDGIKERIRVFIGRLPPDDRADQQLTFWARTLRKADENRRNSGL